MSNSHGTREVCSYLTNTYTHSHTCKGSSVLVVTSTDVDKTGASYYGEQGLLHLSDRGDGTLVILDKKGPIYDVQWHPNSQEFCVLYGCILTPSHPH